MISAVELAAVQDRPALFSTFLMWLLAELFEELPEVGDLDKPKLVFFFDEAHLLFTGASKAFLESVTQTVRLIRSKGVGIFFVTQNPTDVPSAVLGQLGNRVQHALRTFTPEDAKALRKTVSTFPESDDYDIAEMLTSLGTGEAAVTVLSERGSPTPVAWTMLRAPRSLMAPVDPAVLDGRRRRLAAVGQVRRSRSTGTPPTSGSPPGSLPRRRPRSGACAASPSCRTRGRRSPSPRHPRRRGRDRGTAGGRRRRQGARLGGVPVLRPLGRLGAGPRAHPRHLRQPPTPPLRSGAQAQGAPVSRAQTGQARSSPPSGGQSPSTTSTCRPHSARKGGSFPRRGRHHRMPLADRATRPRRHAARPRTRCSSSEDISPARASVLPNTHGAGGS